MAWLSSAAVLAALPFPTISFLNGLFCPKEPNASCHTCPVSVATIAISPGRTIHSTVDLLMTSTPFEKVSGKTCVFESHAKHTELHRRSRSIHRVFRVGQVSRIGRI